MHPALVLLLTGLLPLGCSTSRSVARGTVDTRPSAGSFAGTGRSLELVNGQWYTDSGFVTRTFYVDGGVLRSGRPATVDSTIDLRGGFVIPPFGDAHTHNLDGAFNHEKVRDAYISEGTFYVAVLTNTATGAAQVRERFNRPCDLDVVYANGGITSTLSHPFLAYEPRAMRLQGDWNAHAAGIRKSRIRENNAYWFIDNLHDLNVKWPAILAARPGIIKIFLLDASEHPPAMSDSGLPGGHGLRPSLVPELVKRAHAAGVRVAAHVETAADFGIAVDGGVDLIAHLPGYSAGMDGGGRALAGASMTRYEIPDEVARKAGARRIAVTPTLSLTFMGSGPDSVAALAARQALMTRNISRLRMHGARIVVGSDWFGQTATREISAMRASGAWDDAALLRMWAIETPRTIFPERRIGHLAPGYEASFLVLDANPLERFDAVKAIRLRMKQGCLL